jgi:L-amino acid N-acyltransferase YncA
MPLGNMALLIRSSVDDDVEAIAVIYGASVVTDTASWEYEAPSVEEVAQRRRDILAKGFPYFVAEIEGRVVGYCYASSYRSRIGYRFVVENSVYIREDARGQGVAKKLLVTLIEACTKNGYRHMIAVIGDSENEASIKLHESCGFEHVATFKNIGYKFDRELDSVQMMRVLAG